MFGWAKKSELEDLRNEIGLFRAEIDALKPLTEDSEAQRLIFQQDREDKRAIYQQAADWVKMVNTVTWSLSSIYLVAAILALNTAMQIDDATWRFVAGCAVAVLGVTWLAIDLVYTRSARHARERLAELEAGMEQEFFTEQNEHRAGRRLVTAALVIAMLGAAYVGLVVAKPGFKNLPGWADRLIPMVPIRKPPAS